LLFISVVMAGVHFCAPVSGQQTVAQSLAILEERLNRLAEELRALQFNQERMQEQIRELHTELLELRRAAGAVSARDLEQLETRLRAMDAARERDKQVILDQLAKELIAISTARGAAAGGAAATGIEHIVKPGENLSAIAKQHGVGVSDIARANNLANPDEIRVGQRLIIPK
jgi:LysM repeat protein